MDRGFAASSDRPSQLNFGVRRLPRCYEITAGSQDALARIIAGFGALVATAGLVWTIRRDMRDRGKVQVRAKVPVSDNMGYDIVGDLFVFEVVKAGRRAIHVREVGGRYQDGKPFALALFAEVKVPAQSLPAKLEPTERALLRTVLPNKPRSVRALSAWDTFGAFRADLGALGIRYLAGNHRERCTDGARKMWASGGRETTRRRATMQAVDVVYRER